MGSLLLKPRLLTIIDIKRTVKTILLSGTSHIRRKKSLMLHCAITCGLKTNIFNKNAEVELFVISNSFMH